MKLDKIIALCSAEGSNLSRLERECGLSNAAIRRWENSSPSAENLQKVADHFGVSVDYLLGRDDYSIGKARGKEPEPFDPNEFDSIREEFIERFEREPDAAFLPSVRAQMVAGKSEQDVIEVIRQAAQRHPHNPEAYILAALKQYESKPQEPPADRPLEQWEQDWIAEVQRRREQMGGCAT